MDLENEVLKLKESLEQLEKRFADLESASKNGGLTQSFPTKKTSIKEFMLTKNPRDDVQRSLLIGYFLEKVESYSSFNKKDLEQGFFQAKEKIPLNINDKVNMNIKNGHFMMAPQKKDGLTAWIVTSSGERWVEGSVKQ